MEWTTENLKWFFSQSPPRQVDETLLADTLNIIFPKFLRVLFTILPVIMLLVMSFTLSVFIRIGDFRGEWRLISEPAAASLGKIMEVERRKGSKGSIVHVYRFQFKPVDRAEANDPPVEGVCFCDDPIASPGQAVRIEYIPDEPKISRLPGCRLNPFPLASLIALPVIAGITALFPLGILRYKKRWMQRMLTLGTVTPAIIEKLKPGPKGSLVVELGFDINGRRLNSKTNVSGRKDEKEWMTSLHESGRPVTLLVDPNKTRSVFILDLLLKPWLDKERL